jgi:protein involved in polysaccharide export with SLBB domain
MSMKHPLLAALVVLIMAAPGPALAQNGVAAPDTLDVLRPGDVVRLAVWREDAFSGDFTVDRSGRVVLPRLGPVEVTGVPTAELREQILEGLGRYLRNPSMDVVFLRRIAIHGAVMRAGLYPVDPTMTVLDALALAGGARHDGRLDRIRLIREGENVMTIPTTGMQMEELRIRSGDQLMVPEQTWFRRNNMLIATGISAAASLAIALLYISRG